MGELSFIEDWLSSVGRDAFWMPQKKEIGLRCVLQCGVFGFCGGTLRAFSRLRGNGFLGDS
jgi:hypothetical protein